MKNNTLERAAELLEGLALEPGIDLVELRNIILELRGEEPKSLHDELEDMLAHIVHEEDPKDPYEIGEEFQKKFVHRFPEEHVRVIKHTNPVSDNLSICFLMEDKIRVFSLGAGFNRAMVSDYTISEANMMRTCLGSLIANKIRMDEDEM